MCKVKGVQWVEAVEGRGVEGVQREGWRDGGCKGAYEGWTVEDMKGWRVEVEGGRVEMKVGGYV